MHVAEMIEELESRGVALWANGDRLGYRSPKGVLSGQDLAALKANKERLLEHLRERDGIPHDEQSRFAVFPMTDVQRAYATGQNSGYELGGTGCHSYVELRTERLDPNRLEQAWHALIQRHDMLSAVVIPPDSLRVVASQPLPSLGVIDFSGHDPDVPDEKYLRCRRELEDRTYPLGSWPLHEFRLLQFDECSIIQFSVDMIIADFVSVTVMTEELLALHAGQELPPIAETTFRDVIEARAKRAVTTAGTAERSSAKRYWSEAITSMQGKPPLPTRESSGASRGNPVRFTRRTWTCAPEQWAAFTRYAGSHGVTSSAALLTAYVDVIRRWSSSSDFSVNVTSMNRDQVIEGINRIVGDFTEVTVHACHPRRAPFLDRVRATQEQLSEELTHRAFPGVEVLRELGRALGTTVTIPVVFTGALGAGARAGAGSQYRLVYGVSRTPQVWIDCQAFESGDACTINWDVRDGIFEPTVLADMWTAFTDLLDRLASQESAWQQNETVPLSPQTQAIRARIHNTAKERPAHCLQDGFWDCAQHAPDAPALVVDATTYSYREVAASVEALQQRLAAVGPGDLVAVALGKSVWQIAAVLAVLSRGAAYVPIDRDQPPARQRRVIDACAPAAIIGEDHLPQPGVGDTVIDVRGIEVGAWSSRVPVSFDPTETAYVIFTSGSTGTPKGVVMTHAAAANTIDDINERLGHRGPRTVFGVSKLSFDLSVYDIFGTFSSGGTLVLPSEGESLDPSRWIKLMELNDVDTWNSVPALFQMLLKEREATDEPPGRGMRLVMLSGDMIPRSMPAVAAAHFPNAELISLGGATEAGIWSIFHRMEGDASETNIPYGTALSNQGVWVLDESGFECPDGVHGRIHISGDSLATEYFDDPRTTSEKFRFNDTLGIRTYDTGDVGSYRSDGVIEFHGRTDHQLKINGHRVEIGEIESVLESHAGVDRAVVIPRDTGDRTTLHAFVTPAAHEETEVDTRRAEASSAGALRTMLQDHWAEADSSFDPDVFATWTRLGNEASLAALLSAFQDAGMFLVAGHHHDLEEIMAKVAPDHEYEGLVARWLQILEAEGILHREDQGWTVAQDTLNIYDVQSLWDRFGELEAQMHNSRELFAYQRHAAQSLLRQLRGDVNPVDLFFPEGGLENARAIYGENRISVALNTAVTEAVIALATSREEHDVRILEVGAGVGATTEGIVPRLPHNVTEYHFTDVSTFFLRKARERFEDFPVMTYGLYDINVENSSQDIELGAYDIIVCANVLHNAVNIEEAFGRLDQLRRRGGIIVMIEPVMELYAALISISIKIGLVPFTDHRAESHKVFIEEAEWDRVFTATGLHRIAEYPRPGDPLRESGQRVIIVGGSENPPVDDEMLLDHLRHQLPAHMIPATVRLLEHLPLTANGKVDRKALAQACHQEEARNPTSIEPPRNDVEKQIAQIWTDVLEISGIGRDDDFHSLGGDSLLMAETVTLMRQNVLALQAHTWDTLMREMLRTPTIAGVASLASDPERPNEDPHRSADFPNAEGAPIVALSTVATGSRSGSNDLHVYRLPEQATSCRAMFHAGTGRLKDYEFLVPELLRRQPQMAHVGFTAGDAEDYLACSTPTLIRDRARAYAQELFELNMDSYELVGYCIGGFFALETAKVLTELGRNVQKVTCISTHLCPHRVKNELLCEFAYGCIFDADLEAMGAHFGLDELSDALEHIVAGVNRDITDEELCTLDGHHAAVGKFFAEMSELSPRSRRRRIYDAIREFDADSQSTRGMLDILYDVFRHSLLGSIGYTPEIYLGDVVVLHPADGVPGFYPELGGDVDWSATALGDLRVMTIPGSHATCLLPQNIPALLPFFQEGE